MFTRFISHLAAAFTLTCLFAAASTASAQDDKHGRKYKAPAETAHIVVLVLKASNGKPVPNAAVIFHPIDKDGKDQGAMDIKSDPEGKATLDLIPVGSTLRLQVLATGFAPYGGDYDIPVNTKDITVKLVSPRAQVSAYEDTTGKAAPDARGIQQKATPTTTPAPAPAPKQ